ncbi:hypothetical protein EDB19DRAFT_1785485 [Suillus lakei]|nr:hypothetical protein EDB19DRAFT_1785485 [Suillus lakei]
MSICVQASSLNIAASSRPCGQTRLAPPKILKPQLDTTSMMMHPLSSFPSPKRAARQVRKSMRRGSIPMLLRSIRLWRGVVLSLNFLNFLQTIITLVSWSVSWSSRQALQRARAILATCLYSLLIMYYRVLLQWRADGL